MEFGQKSINADTGLHANSLKVKQRGIFPKLDFDNKAHSSSSSTMNNSPEAPTEIALDFEAAIDKLLNSDYSDEDDDQIFVCSQKSSLSLALSTAGQLLARKKSAIQPAVRFLGIQKQGENELIPFSPLMSPIAICSNEIDTNHCISTNQVKISPFCECNFLPNLQPSRLVYGQKLLAESERLSNYLTEVIHCPSVAWKQIGVSKGVTQRSWNGKNRKVTHSPLNPDTYHAYLSEHNLPTLFQGTVELGEDICPIEAARFFFETDPMLYNSYLAHSYRTEDFALGFNEYDASKTTSAILSTYYQNIRGKFGFADREFHMSCYMKATSPHHAIFCSSSDLADQKYKSVYSKHSTVRARCLVGGVDIRRARHMNGPPVQQGECIKDTKVYLSFIWQCDLNGSLPSWIQSIICNGSLNNTVRMKEHCLAWLNNGKPVDPQKRLPVTLKNIYTK